jgi:DNA-directed RNA polymerase specialized sigma24 family protein
MAEDAREDRAREPRTPECQDLRPLLSSIAHGIVGSVSEASDIVQKAFLHFTGNRVRMRTS